MYVIVIERKHYNKIIRRFVKVYNLITDNLSYNKNATQSSTYLGLDKFSAKLAVDRNTSSCMRTHEIGLNSSYQTMWWKVDLGRVYSIHSVTIIFKTYNGYGMYYCILICFLSVCNYIFNTYLFCQGIVAWEIWPRFFKLRLIKILEENTQCGFIC